MRVTHNVIKFAYLHVSLCTHMYICGSYIQVPRSYSIIYYFFQTE